MANAIVATKKTPPRDYSKVEETAIAQSGQNNATAINQQLLNMINQTGPGGSKTFTQSGFNTYKDPITGKMISVPRFNETTKLDKNTQALYDKNIGIQGGLADLGKTQIGQIKSRFAKPFDYNVGAHEKWANAQYNALNGANQKGDMQSLETQLLNKGLTVGSPAYNQEMSRLRQDQNMDRTRFGLESYNTGMNTAIAKRNQPLSEFGALKGFGGVQMPTFGATPNVGVGGTDIAGLQAAADKAKADKKASMWGGIAGIAGSVLSSIGPLASLFSDERLKENKRKVGKLNDGTPVYTYNYKNGMAGGVTQLGVMAHEAKKKNPQAVSVDPKSGYKMVNYAMLDNIPNKGKPWPGAVKPLSGGPAQPIKV